jgi:hypothetical protein
VLPIPAFVPAAAAFAVTLSGLSLGAAQAATAFGFKVSSSADPAFSNGLDAPAIMPSVAPAPIMTCDKPNVVCSNQPGGRDLLRFAGVTGATFSPPTITFARIAYLSGLKWPLPQLFSHFVLVNHELSDPVSRTVPVSVMSNTFDLTDIINANRGN